MYAGDEGTYFLFTLNSGFWDAEGTCKRYAEAFGRRRGNLASIHNQWSTLPVGTSAVNVWLGLMIQPGFGSGTKVIQGGWTDSTPLDFVSTKFQFDTAQSTTRYYMLRCPLGIGKAQCTWQFSRLGGWLCCAWLHCKNV
eukprot:gene8726-33689_t